MGTKFITSLFMCLTMLVSGQNILFQNNVNYEAKSLIQHLNKFGDSLILESKTTIGKVDIFNKDYSKTINVKDHKTEIDLKELPAGNFIVNVQMGRKYIVLYLEKGHDRSFKDDRTFVVGLDSDSHKCPKRSSYWVVYERNNNLGSSKTMKLEDEDRVARLIVKNKLEQKTKVGRRNTLFIYEVYNVSEFMDRQLQDPQFYRKTKHSNLFNVTPFYNTPDLEQSSRTSP